MWSVIVWILILSVSFSLGTCRKREPSYEMLRVHSVILNG